MELSRSGSLLCRAAPCYAHSLPPDWGRPICTRAMHRVVPLLAQTWVLEVLGVRGGPCSPVPISCWKCALHLS